MLHIEWGADSLAGRHSEDPYTGIHITMGQGTEERGLAYKNTGGPPRISRDGDWSETYACDLFDWHLKTQESLPWLTGMASSMALCSAPHDATAFTRGSKAAARGEK